MQFSSTSRRKIEITHFPFYELSTFSAAVCRQNPYTILVRSVIFTTLTVTVAGLLEGDAVWSGRWVDCVWNVMAHAQKPDLVFRRNGWVHLNRRRRQFIRLLAAEVCASAVVMLDTPCSEVMWRLLAAQFIRQFPLHFPPCVTVCHHTGLYRRFKVGAHL